MGTAHVQLVNTSSVPNCVGRFGKSRFIVVSMYLDINIYLDA
jgi:hypothetical protein